MQSNVLEKLQRFASERRGRILLVIAILVLSLIVKLLLFHYHGYHVDEGTFKAWYNIAADNGLRNFYDSTWCDYPPFSVYIFWIFGNLAHAMGPDSLDFLIKLPQNLFDLATAYLIFCFVRSRFSFLQALCAMAIYAFNPATIFDLAVWGQFDSIPTFFVLLTVYAFIRNQALKGSIWAGISILFKHYAAFLLPFMLLTQKIMSALKYLLITIGVVAVVCLPYIINSANRFFYWSITSLLTRPEDLGLMMLSPHNKILKIIFLLIFLILYFYLIWRFLKKSDKSAGEIIQYSILATLLIYALVMFHSQFIILILPLLAIYFAINRDWASKTFYWFATLFSTGIIMLGCWRIFTQDLPITPNFYYFGIAWDKVYNIAVPIAGLILFLIILLRKGRSEKVFQE